MRDLGKASRVVVATGWIALQLTLVATGGLREDRLFAFQMFNESSTLKVHLYRRLKSPAGVLSPVALGEWDARGLDGSVHRVRWRDHVKPIELGLFDRTLHASYGVQAQLSRWRAALDYVATHTPEDAETDALVADVMVVRNGHERSMVRLTSVPR